MFASYNLTQSGITEVENAKIKLGAVIHDITMSVPDSKDRAIALTKIEEACFFLVRAIASKDGNSSDNRSY